MASGTPVAKPACSTSASSADPHGATGPAPPRLSVPRSRPDGKSAGPEPWQRRRAGVSGVETRPPPPARFARLGPAGFWRPGRASLQQRSRGGRREREEREREQEKPPCRCNPGSPGAGSIGDRCEGLPGTERAQAAGRERCFASPNSNPTAPQALPKPLSSPGGLRCHAANH